MLRKVTGGFAHRVGAVGNNHLLITNRVEGGGKFRAVCVRHIQAVFTDKRADLELNISNHPIQKVLGRRCTNIEGTRN